MKFFISSSLFCNTRHFHSRFLEFVPHRFPACDSVPYEIFPAGHCAQATVSAALFTQEFCLPTISATDVVGSIGRHPHLHPNGLLPSCPASPPYRRYSSSPVLSLLRRFSHVLVCSKYPLERGFGLRCCHLCMPNYRNHFVVLFFDYAIAYWVSDREIFRADGVALWSLCVRQRNTSQVRFLEGHSVHCTCSFYVCTPYSFS